MIGIHHVEVSNRDAKFKFDLYRNITIVRGKSGTGKTTLFDMIADHTRLGDSSGVNISCDKKCVALVDIDWKNQLRNLSDSIVFIDEGAEFLSSKDFAEEVKRSDNYYVIFNREGLHELPYSVEEIYEIKSSGRFHSFKKMYKSNKKHIYYNNTIGGKVKYDALLTEDSKSGYQFYQSYFSDSDIECFTAGSNSAIFKWLNEHKDRNVFVVADGAAFGSEIDRVLKLQTSANFKLCLPESFEWLILKSGLIRTNDIDLILAEPSNFIESSEYFSWEIYFERYLIENTADTPFWYRKREINDIYLSKANSEKIIVEIYIK